MKKIIIVIIIILTAINLGANDKNTNIALHYYIQAKSLFDNKKYKSAEDLLLQSLEFDPNFSESLYLLSQVYLTKQETTAKGLIYLTQALQENSWILTSPLEAKQVLAKTYIQIKKYREAMAVIQELKNDYVSNPFLEILTAKAFAGVRDYNSAIFVLKDALKLFPKTLEIYLTYIDFLLRLNLEYDANILIKQALKEFPDSVSLLYYSIIVERDDLKRVQLINQYYILGGKDPRVALYALKSGTEQVKHYLDYFFEHKGPYFNLLLKEIFALTADSEELSAYLKQRLGTIEGEKVIDTNEDGFFEERYFYENNNLIQWLLDDNQDGQAELAIVFEKNIPKSISIYKQGLLTSRFYFSNYPLLEKACFVSEKVYKCYDIIPNSLSLMVLASIPEKEIPLFRITLNADLSYPLENTIAQISFAYSEYSPDSKELISKWDIYNGVKIALREDTDNNEIPDHIVIYDKGIPISGMQDYDGDGYYEIKEIYRNGQIIAIEYDEDNDGLANYMQTFGYEGLKQWDLNGDNIYDIKEYKNADGIIVREYSTALNGIFDLKILVKD